MSINGEDQRPDSNDVAEVYLAKTPDALIPDANKTVERSYYNTLHITAIPGDENLEPITEPMDPFANVGPTQYGNAPAVGVLLTHEQVWKQTGLSLGSLLNSVCLAPGEVTKVAMIDWRRRTAASSSETVGQREHLENEAKQNRAVSEVQNAVAKQSMSGSSSVAGTSTSMEGAASASFLGLFGGSNARSRANTNVLSVSNSVGERNLAAASNQQIQQRTMEASQAARSRRATVVKEIDEGESESLTARVVANYNHAHALTVLYFEVLQVFRMTTRISEAERCIFLPMKVISFNKDTLEEHRAKLIAIASDLGIEDLRQLLLRRGAESLAGSTEKKPKDLVAKRKELVRKASSGWPTVLAVLRNREEFWNGPTFDTDRRLGAKVLAKPPPKDGSERRQYNIYVTLHEADVALASAFRALKEIPSPDRGTSRVIALRLALNGLEKGENLVESMGLVGPFAELIRLVRMQLRYSEEVEALDQEIELEKSLGGISVERLCKQLNEEQLFFNQQIWLRMDEHLVHQMLAGRCIDGEPLLGRVDPVPVGVFGNYVAYRWRFAPFTSKTGTRAGSGRPSADEEDCRVEFLRNLGLSVGDSEPNNPDSLSNGMAAASTETSCEIALPSDGLFAEAVLGQAVSAEKIDLTRFWKWQDSPIPILPPEMEKLKAGSRARDVDVGAGHLDPALVRLFGPQAMPDPSGMGGLLQALAKSDMFKDMSGQEAVAQLGKMLAEASAKGASHAADSAVAANKNVLDTITSLATAKDASVLGGLLNVSPALVSARAGTGAAAKAKAASGNSKAAKKAEPAKKPEVSKKKESKKWVQGKTHDEEEEKEDHPDEPAKKPKPEKAVDID